jgi:hypothetical protein
VWTLEKPRRDKSGRHWNFYYWYSGWSSDPSRKAQRLFFWDDSKDDCGAVLFLPGKTVPYSRIKSLIEKLVADQDLRKRHQRELQFPLEKHYSEYPVFPEELSNI